MQAICVANIRNKLGEGCIWDVKTQRYYWVDIADCKLFSLDAKHNLITYNMPERTAFIFPRLKGGFVLGFPKHLVSCDENFSNFEIIAEIESHLPQTRLNDATVALDGSLIFGTMDEQNQQPIGNIYRFSTTGLEKLIPNIAISNGLACNSETLFYTDTAEGIIHSCQIKPDFIELVPTAPLAKRDIAPGLPDGACLDSAGNYWLARVWGNCVICLDKEGKVLHQIKLPIKTPTCVCFGGQDLNELFITSLSLRHTEQDFIDYPLSGGAFIVPTSFKGLTQTNCNF